MEKLYEGKAKILYATEEEGILRLEYKDSVTALNGLKKDELAGKGRINNEISALIFEMLRDIGIGSHYIKKISETEQLVSAVKVIPLEVVVRNIAAGSMSKRLGIEEGTRLDWPVVEFYYKDDSLGDPLVTLDHIKILKVADEVQVEKLHKTALDVNIALQRIFAQAGIVLVDFKLEFGTDGAGGVVLADEVSPDTCRLWDEKTGEKLDKDIYRRDLGDMLPGYEEVLSRLILIRI